MRHANPKTEVLERFVLSVLGQAANGGEAFDSAAIPAFTSKLIVDDMPEQITAVAANLEEKYGHVVFDSVLDGF